MADSLKIDETYYLGLGSIIWNPMTEPRIGRCPRAGEWDVEKFGLQPMEEFGMYVKYCSSGNCEKVVDYDYDELWKMETGSCHHLTTWYKDTIVGYCTGEGAEKYYFGTASEEIEHGGGHLSIYSCGAGRLTGTVVIGVSRTDVPPEEREELRVGDPIETHLGPGMDYTLQVFADDDFTCGTLGIGGNWMTDPERRGWSYIEVIDPFQLRCPGHAGQPDLDGAEYEFPNYAVPLYKVVGTITKYTHNLRGGSDVVEYMMQDAENWVYWTSEPPPRPIGAEWPPRHTDVGAWVGETSVIYNTESEEPIAMKWWMELVWYQKEGHWMIILYPEIDEDGNLVPKESLYAPVLPSKYPGERSWWYDVLINKYPIGPCRLNLVEKDEERTFYPLRTPAGSDRPIDGQLMVELPTLPIERDYMVEYGPV